MSLAAGSRLGPYEILAQIGEGGMGTVYRALDSKLKRTVAIKILSDALADAEARRRFQREAQTASSLNHPHILTVHDAGEFEGQQYLVTEFVDGGTLKTWAGGEQRTWKQIVELLVGVADGLAAAHQAGILHRDIKPANILVAKNGYAKLADFGLARLTELQEDDETRTLTELHTRPGAVVGTVAYMSPEQASGRPLDARSDIFSFGVVLYELLAGRRPFAGGTEMELMKQVVYGTPEPLAQDVPLALRMIVEKGIEKDPADRYQTMRDVVVDLKRVQRTAPEAASQAARKPPGGWLGWAAIAVVFVIAVGAGLWLYLRPPGDPLTDAKYTQLTDYPGDEESAAISADGKLVLFMSDRDGSYDLLVGQVGDNQFRNLTHGTFSPIKNTRAAIFAFNGSDICLMGPPPRTNRMSLMPLFGGSPRPFLSDTTTGISWSPDGKQTVYTLSTAGDAMWVADGDGSTNARQIYMGLHNHFPTWSADGRWIYFAHGDGVGSGMDLWRIAPTGREPEQLTHHNTTVSFPTPLDARTVLYLAEDETGGPWMWAFDTERKVTRRVHAGLEKYSSLAATADGRRLVTAIAHPTVNLWTVPIDHQGEEREVTQVVLPHTRARAPRFGPDSSLFYLSSLDGSDGLWRFQNGQASPVWNGSDGTVLARPEISPDGQQVAIVVRVNGKRRLRVVAADGSGKQPFIETLEVWGSPSWSPDGKWIVRGGNDGNGNGLFKVPVEGGRPVALLSGLLSNPVWSPNRDLIVYVGSNVAAETDLRAVHADGSHVDFPAVKIIDNAPVRFTVDGKGLIYLGKTGSSGDFWRLDLDTNVLSQLTQVHDPTTIFGFDVTPNGKQIVFERRRGNSDIWLIDLKR